MCVKSYVHSDSDCRKALQNKNGCFKVDGHDCNFLVMLAYYTMKNLESSMRGTGTSSGFQNTMQNTNSTQQWGS